MSLDSKDGREIFAHVQSLEPGMATTVIQMRKIEPYVLLRFSGDEPVTIDGMLVLRKRESGKWRVERRYVFSIE